jgi:hypothetical protein
MWMREQTAIPLGGNKFGQVPPPRLLGNILKTTFGFTPQKCFLIRCFATHDQPSTINHQRSTIDFSSTDFEAVP